ncbi:hypothetical protein HAD_05315 [Hyphomonas adhaerens MHS-3]|uniref:Uncharacterized protein n=1 Tax=Hyphomonas adhaerens MHS-3 TaxID=1280949 RepID=A0A069E525_9PROT|nr:hypothetical protein [Hyphomonas adhaerens]KCZ85074.1 hypothetical protein HAD_05315 [Hyphomonas adhaerens MHS-3]
MKQKFVSGVFMGISSMVRRGTPPFDECVVDGKINWDRYGPIIYKLIKERMNWDRKSLFKSYFKKRQVVPKETSLHPLESFLSEPVPEQELDDPWPSYEFVERDMTSILEYLVECRLMNDLARQCFLLRVREELTYVEIGERIGRSKTRAEYWHKKAVEVLENENIRERIRSHFEGGGHESRK